MDIYFESLEDLISERERLKKLTENKDKISKTKHAKEDKELTENSSPRSSLVRHSPVSASSFGGEGRLNELSYDVSGTRYDILDLDDFEEERAEEERERKERGGMIVPTIAIHPYFHKNKQIYQAANAQTTTFEMTLNESSFFSSSSSSASIFPNPTATSLFTSSSASSQEAEAAGENAMRKNIRGKGQFIVEDKEEEERRKSEQSVLNGSESEVSKSASLKDRHARDTYSVIS
ncbi:uncharacterized protein MONOS_18345 [Monocercomonoides exilis]|uniref:uncharacterized protein n=1 Tax=Monocercomonoides exilis TaxID=2049356 RepID=UPI00355A3BA4|nr:hypothetical protein MONOS_18345 [Monocercomonoides exilis]